MTDMDKAVAYIILGFWLAGLPIFAGYVAGFYGVFVFFAILAFGLL